MTIWILNLSPTYTEHRKKLFILTALVFAALC